MAFIAGCGPDQIAEHNLAFDTNRGITNRDNTASLIFSATGITFAGSGGIAFANGTAAAPSVNFVGATTTGLYRPAAGTLGIAIAGVAGLAIAGAAPTF